jgi:hypothetical protein
VELLLRPRHPIAPIVWDAPALPVYRFPPQLLGVHAGPAVALENVSASLGEDDQRPVLPDRRNRLDQARVLEMPKIAPMRIQRAVLAVAQIAGWHDAKGADRRQRADLRATQRHVAVSCPDTLTFTATRQFEVAREHVAGLQPLAFPRIGQPAAAALVELATVDIAIARVVNRARVEVHRCLLWEERA